MCLLFCSQGVWYLSMHCRWYSSMPCSRSPGRVISQHALQVSRPTPRGEVEGLVGWGLQTHTWEGAKSIIFKASRLHGSFLMLHFLPPAMKLGQGYVFTHVCDSVHRGDGIPACIAGSIPACLAAGLQASNIPACIAGFQAHTQGEVEGSGQVGSQAHTWGVSRPIGGSPGPHLGGVYPSMHWGRSPQQLLLWVARILLECILVT